MALSTENKIRITTEAVNWIHRLEAEPEETTADEFASWLRKSPHHLPSFLNQSRIETAMRRVRAERIAQRREASQSVVASSASPPSGAKRVRWRSWSLGATLLVLATLIAPPLVTKPTLHGSATTAVDVQFSDGSTAKLYPGTQISEKRIAWFRKITLLYGAARFFVDDHLLQHFQVQTDSALITATGTEFNVLHAGDHTGIYVADGSIVVEGNPRKNGAIQQAMLRAGASADVSTTGAISNLQQPAPPASAGSGDMVSLATLATEINRRNLLPQIVVEGKARQVRFERPDNVQDPEALIAAMATYSDLEIEWQGKRATIRSVEATQE